jgi:alcohol dehydrogenase class IV
VIDYRIIFASNKVKETGVGKSSFRKWSNKARSSRQMSTNPR